MRKPTKEEKPRIIELARTGMKPVEIARELGDVDARAVIGVIYSAVKAKKLVLPNSGNSTPLPPENFEMASTPAASPAPQTPPPAQAVHQTPAPAQGQNLPADGFAAWRTGGAGSSGSFVHPSQTIRYTVERKVPQDGILGQHVYPFSEIDLGNMYGEGIYKLTRYIPGRAQPDETEVKISSSFGPSRFPKSAYSTGNVVGDRKRDDDSHEPRRPAYDPRYYDMARQMPMPPAESAATEAIKQMGILSVENIRQSNEARKMGPETSITDFFKQQQAISEDRAREDRKRDEERLADQEKKAEVRLREERERQERKEQDEQRRHEREMERIKAEADARSKQLQEERKMLLELEDRKIQMIREEAKMHKDALEAELRRSRDEVKEIQNKMSEAMKSMQERTMAEIQANRESLADDMERERDGLEREHKLKEKSLDKEHELNKQILDIKQESMSKEGGDQILGMLQTLVKEGSKAIEKIVDLQKIQAMSPEAQAAAVAKGSMDGNVLGEPKREERVIPSTDTVLPPRVTPGNGHAKVQEESPKSSEEKMDAIIQEMLKKEQFKEIVREWSLHIEQGEDATAFANMYLELMRDPANDEARKACAAFATYMKPRNWAMMLKAIRAHIEPAILKIFETPQAELFYESFRAMVVEQIREYWEQFLANRKSQQQARQAAVTEVTEPVEEDGTPLPSREALRR